MWENLEDHRDPKTDEINTTTLAEDAGAALDLYEDDKVPSGCGCPKCGEDRVDWLLLDEDGETVECQVCGMKYRVEVGEGVRCI